MALKKAIKISVVISELLYDIMTETYLKSRTGRDGADYKAAANMYASLDEDDRDKIRRSIKRSWSEIKAVVAEYLPEKCQETDSGLTEADNDLSLTLSMPGNFNEGVTESIAEKMHDYVRNATVRDWYLITNKADAPEYEAMAVQALATIRNLVNRRSRPSRRASIKVSD